MTESEKDIKSSLAFSIPVLECLLYINIKPYCRLLQDYISWCVVHTSVVAGTICIQWYWVRDQSIVVILYTTSKENVQV